MIQVNNKYPSLFELKTAVKILEESTHTVYIIQDSVKTKIPLCKESHKYDRVVFACKQGKGRKPQGKGIRPTQRSVKVGCSAKIRAVLKEEAGSGTWHFLITHANIDHDTHTPSREALAVFPECRKIADTPGMAVLLKCPSVSAKDIVKIVGDEQGKFVTTKDVHNMRQKSRGQPSPDAAQVEATLKTITDEGGHVDFGALLRMDLQ